MGLFHPRDDSIHLKVVYYGAAFGGKTTNLAWVKALLDPEGRYGMLSVDTGDDSTLFFDHLPLTLRLLERYTVVIEAYTVPGQVRYDATRRAVLRGADGVVFVADSRLERMDENLASLANLRQNLAELALPADLPITLQWNQRDRDTAGSVDHLQTALNPDGAPSCAAVSVRGEGVLETLRVLLRDVWRRAHAEYGFARRGLPLEDALAAIDDALVPAGSADEVGDPGVTRTRVRAPTWEHREHREHRGPGADEGAGRSDADLLEAAVHTGLELASLAALRAAGQAAAQGRLDRALLTGQRVLHDVRKPLCALRNALHVLTLERDRLERPAALDLASAVIEEMSRQISKAAACFESAGDSDDPHQRVNTEEVVLSVLRQLSYPATDAAVRLESKGGMPDLLWTREALSSVMINLVGNAVRYHGARPGADASAQRFVEVAARRTRRGLLLAVRDNGPGIEEGVRAHIFERNVRGASSIGAGGSGLGLFLVREQAHAIGARVGLRTKPGSGSVFYLMIPTARLADPQISDLRRSRSEASSAASLS